MFAACAYRVICSSKAMVVFKHEEFWGSSALHAEASCPLPYSSDLCDCFVLLVCCAQEVHDFATNCASPIEVHTLDELKSYLKSYREYHCSVVCGQRMLMLGLGVSL